MSKDAIKTLIKIANLQNNNLKTVIKARSKFKDLLNEALNNIRELVTINREIETIRDILDNPKYDQLCDRSKDLFDKIKLTDMYKYVDLLPDLLDNPNKNLAELADDLIDLIDENKEYILGRHNPLKGYKSSPIPL